MAIPEQLDHKLAADWFNTSFLSISLHRAYHCLGHLALSVLCHEYLPDSLKAATRKKRGKGIRRRVEPFSSIPRQAFLRIDKNKVELFSFLAMKIAAKQTEKQIVSTHSKDVFCTQPRDVHTPSCVHISRLGRHPHATPRGRWCESGVYQGVSPYC